MEWAGLVEAIKAGDPIAEHWLANALAGRLQSYCRMVAGEVLGTLEQEAVVEQTLARVISKIDTFKEERASLPEWARGIMRNQIRDVLRGRREVATDDAILNSLTTISGDAEAWIEGDEDSLKRARPVELAIVELMQKLDRAQADLVYMRAAEGLTFAQIAARLQGDVDEATLRKRYQRARDRLLLDAASNNELKGLL
jgi:RNA polymerase sigma factor (sigma-70 family)